MGADKISYLSLLIYLLIGVVPVLLFLYLKVKLVRPMVFAIIRMVVQLAFVALYLEYIFKLDDPRINLAYILIMILVANQTILRRSGLRFRVFFLATMPAYLIAVAFCFLTFFIVLDVRTIFTARYLIPLGGMILGNILRGNIISLERLYHSLTRRQEEYIYYLSMGASLREALIPFMGEALRSSIEPYLATISTMGLVSLPGMMTGQILGGAAPLVAIQYQVMIMAAILVASTLSIFLVMTLSARVAFDPFGRLRENIFIPGRFRRNS